MKILTAFLLALLGVSAQAQISIVATNTTGKLLVSGSLTVTNTPPPGCVDYLTGLVNRWNFDTVFTDTVGSGGGTLSGSPSISSTCKVGAGSMSLDGASWVTVNLAHSVFPISAFTISLWANISGTGNNPPREVVISGFGGNHSCFLDLNDSGNVIGNIATTGGSGTGTVFGAVPSTGVWHLWTMTYDGTSFDLYEDASEVSTTGAATGTIAQNGDPANIGSIAGGSTFNGLIDDVRCYSAALTGAQITTIYNATGATCMRDWNNVVYYARNWETPKILLNE